MKQAAESPEVAVRILKATSCPSLSGLSTLTYHVGCEAEPDAEKGEAPEIYIRVFANSGGGLFSREWIPVSSIQTAFATVPPGIACTPHVLSPLFQGKSANTKAFLFAVLKKEGLVSTVKDSRGLYERADPTAFLAEVTALIASDVDLMVEEKPAGKDQKPVSAKSGKVEGKLSAVATKPAASGTKPGKKNSGPHRGNE